MSPQKIKDFAENRKQNFINKLRNREIKLSENLIEEIIVKYDFIIVSCSIGDYDIDIATKELDKLEIKKK
jgi:protein involved in ribonucleotide reduction